MVTDEHRAHLALYPASSRARAGCGCGIQPGMAYTELRRIAAAGSCCHPFFLCPNLDDALRHARRRMLRAGDAA